MSSPELAEPRPLPPGQRLSPALRPVHYGRVPQVDLATWSLRIGGDTPDGEAVSLSWDDHQRYVERGFWEQRGFHITGDVWREERYSYQE